MSLKTEKQTLREMIHLFCKTKHGSDALCADCAKLLDYAEDRLGHCPFGDDKPVCRKCAVHCYKPEMRQRISNVMRVAGPLMLKRNPLSAICHLIRSFRRS